jgi:O-antigen ligase
VKYAVFVLLSVTLVPLMAGVALWRPRWRLWLLAALVFSTALGDMANINFFSLETYRGPDRGFEVNLTDLIALALAIVLVARYARRVRWLPYNSLWMAAYFGVGLLATLIAPWPMLGWFTLFKLAKAYLIFWVVANALRTGVPTEAMWFGMTGIAAFLTILAVKEKYVDHLYRINGPFDHSNSIPLFVNLILPVLLFWSLAGPGLPRRLAGAAVLSTLGLAFAVVATMSRAGIALMGFGLVGALVLANRRAGSRRVTATTALVAVAVLLGGSMAADSLLDRVKNAPESSEEARDEFNAAAGMMLRDHPMGVGLNHFSRVLSTVPRYRDNLVVMANEEQGGVAHHIYRLTAAELGWPGLFLFLVIVGRFLWIALRHGWRSRSLDGSLLTCMGLGFVTLHLSGFLEWGFRITPIFYLFLVMSGFAVALAGQVARPIPRTSGLA